jgi:hypothetical protein
MAQITIAHIKRVPINRTNTFHLNRLVSQPALEPFSASM